GAEVLNLTAPRLRLRDACGGSTKSPSLRCGRRPRCVVDVDDDEGGVRACVPRLGEGVRMGGWARLPPVSTTDRQPRVASVCCARSEEHTSELQSRFALVCRLLLEQKNNIRLG